MTCGLSKYVLCDQSIPAETWSEKKVPGDGIGGATPSEKKTTEEHLEGSQEGGPRWRRHDKHPGLRRQSPRVSEGGGA